MQSLKMKGLKHYITPTPLTLPLLSYFRPKHNHAKIFENHPNPVMLVFIRELSLSTLI